MEGLHFHRINTKEYRARVAAPDGEGWHHAVYVVRCTPALQRNDPFNAWEAESPEGFIIESGIPLGEAMKVCNKDAPSYIGLAHADSTAIITDPALIAEVL
jgi:hypothetical protein